MIDKILIRHDNLRLMREAASRSGGFKRVIVIRPLKMVMIAAVSILFFTVTGEAKGRCGGEGQRPCKIWERIPSCNKGLKESFRWKMCVGPNTRIDAKTGRYIPEKKVTYLNLCNRSTRPTVYAAIAEWIDAYDVWNTRGWWAVAAGRCAKIALGQNYRGSVYVYGWADDGTEWASRDARFCVDGYNAFEIVDADRHQCRTSGLSGVVMAQFDVRPGNNNYNFGN